MWKRIKPQGGAAKRTKFGVVRANTGNQAASIIIPEGEATLSRASVYSDGNGKLGLRLHNKGDRVVYKSGGASAAASRVSIPASLAHLIPFGTRDVEVSREDGMIVIDTAKLG